MIPRAKPPARLGKKKRAALEAAGKPLPFSSIAAKPKKKIGRNKARQAREFRRCFHSVERVEFIKSLSCAATGQFGTKYDPIDNAHVCDDGSKGASRRSGYACIAPLKRSAHRLLHANPEKFAAKYGVFDWPAMAAYIEQLWQQSGRGGRGPMSETRMTLDDHRAYGLQSNIPVCCVEAWIALHETGPCRGEGHVWHVELQRCIAHADCEYVAAIAVMANRGLPDVPAEYIPCERCHREMAAGVRRPNKLRVGEYRPTASLTHRASPSGGQTPEREDRD